MKFKQKWLYVWGGMCLGCIFTLMGFILATAVQDVTAQNLDIESVKFDTIVCRSLNVVDDTGKAVVILGIDEHGGVVIASGKDGKSSSQLSISEHGGYVRAQGKEGKTYSMLSNTEDGGFVKANGKYGLSFAGLAIDEQGGSVGVTDRAGRFKSMAP